MNALVGFLCVAASGTAGLLVMAACVAAKRADEEAARVEGERARRN